VSDEPDELGGPPAGADAVPELGATYGTTSAVAWVERLPAWSSAKML
jgi:hypothetical protein